MDKYVVYFLIGYKIYKEDFFEKTITNSTEQINSWSNSIIYNNRGARTTKYELKNHFLTISSKTFVMEEKNTNQSFYLEYATEDLEKIKNTLTIKSLVKFFKKRF